MGHYFTGKISLFGKRRALQFRTSNIWWTIGMSGEQRRGACFYRGKKEIGEGCGSSSLAAGGGSLLLLGQEIFLPAGICKLGWVICMRAPPRTSKLHFKWNLFIFTVHKYFQTATRCPVFYFLWNLSSGLCSWLSLAVFLLF